MIDPRDTLIVDLKRRVDAVEQENARLAQQLVVQESIARVLREVLMEVIRLNIDAGREA